MSVTYTLREQWFGNVRADLLSGILVALALLMVDLVRDHGLQYLFAATILAGGLQAPWGRRHAAAGH